MIYLFRLEKGGLLKAKIDKPTKGVLVVFQLYRFPFSFLKRDFIKINIKLLQIEITLPVTVNTNINSCLVK